MEIDGKTLRDLKKKIELELEKREVEIIEYWKNELENIEKRHGDLNSLLFELRKLIERMGNRISILKKMIKEKNV